MNEIVKKVPGLIEPEEAYETFIPDTLFPSSNDWEIPDLDDSMQAQEVCLPFCKWGELSRMTDLKGNGCYHFYTDDYKMSALYEHPEKLANAHPKGLVLAEHFGKCLCNFTRNSKNSHRTVAEVCREYNEKEDRRLGQNILGNGI